MQFVKVVLLIMKGQARKTCKRRGKANLAAAEATRNNPRQANASRKRQPHNDRHLTSIDEEQIRDRWSSSSYPDFPLSAIAAATQWRSSRSHPAARPSPPSSKELTAPRRNASCVRACVGGEMAIPFSPEPPLPFLSWSRAGLIDQAGGW